LNKQTKQIIN